MVQNKPCTKTLHNITMSTHCLRSTCMVFVPNSFFARCFLWTPALPLGCSSLILFLFLLLFLLGARSARFAFFCRFRFLWFGMFLCFLALFPLFVHLLLILFFIELVPFREFLLPTSVLMRLRPFLSRLLVLRFRVFCQLHILLLLVVAQISPLSAQFLHHLRMLHVRMVGDEIGARLIRKKKIRGQGSLWLSFCFRFLWDFTV
mmetsp:Transcript_5139/g.8467  ORF Transcript_5139/g.8467 Transcript_5139/m.8467 type:complete len:204 (-) Transcript_5139:188-799(-)